MNSIVNLRKDLYLMDVERLIKRQPNSAEISAIKKLFAQRKSAIETAKLIDGSSDRIDRQNDLA